MTQEELFKTLVAHCKEYGFIFPSSEIYDGLAAVYDYGQLGSELKNNIKQLTGKTVSEFIRDVRMDKAAAYLSQGKLTVKEVMYKVGFTTPSYFTKCFRERFGVLPSDYPGQNAGN